MARGMVKCFNCGNLWSFYLLGGTFAPKQGILCNICSKQRSDNRLAAIYSASLKPPVNHGPPTGSVKPPIPLSGSQIPTSGSNGSGNSPR